MQLLLGSDAPVAPLDPWVSIAASVGRTREGREPWHPERTLTVKEALAATTRWDTDRVEVDAVADLVVVALDPFTSTVDELRTMPVHTTLLDGRVIYAEN